MTPNEIGQLEPGRKTDAEIEEQFFRFKVYGRIGGHFIVDEQPDNPNWPMRDPRKFSSDALMSLIILNLCPGWRMWDGQGGINVQLTRIVGDGLTWINGIGRDHSFCIAICKAALMLVAMVKEWEIRQAAINMAGETTLEMAAEYAPASPDSLIKVKPEGEA